MDIEYRWRDTVTDPELVELTRAHGGNTEPGWWDRIRPHSLGWVSARTGQGRLVGFVNVAWDGGDHAFLLDTKTHPEHQRQGIGTALCGHAARGAHRAGCEWLHVDFRPELAPFYFDSCGFTSTSAGLIDLTQFRV
ncbi:GNAT family N-acetyltransferase [Sciscionella sediminilitoris]|uniref:GNAT family N-acetyltransferase n=1 Tax=Sciscionella sediminilitoris TaxID=1445613 RepID=UPI0004DF3CC2|nr:GNAT family N-acetyltransferase [Sciscionella sp. SE31]